MLPIELLNEIIKYLRCIWIFVKDLRCVGGGVEGLRIFLWGLLVRGGDRFGGLRLSGGKVRKIFSLWCGCFVSLGSILVISHPVYSCSCKNTYGN